MFAILLFYISLVTISGNDLTSNNCAFGLVDHLHALLTAFDTNAEPNEAGSPWDRVQRYIRFHHDEMLQDLERFCTVLTDKYLACTSFESLFEVCEGWRNSTSKEETPLGMISSLWSLADNFKYNRWRQRSHTSLS
uniref:Secreted protein n=1 Tax=Spongospora subterranea TaxID=70186 RepID=A0A0H5R9Y2_9EUKA|eukprot:CRZ10616.1 hypothetical protein [Spongospora subterranea]